MTHKKSNQTHGGKVSLYTGFLGAFSTDLGLDLKTAFKISTCFSGGMRCGNIGGCITAGLLVRELIHNR